MSLIHDMEVQVRHHYKRTNWKHPSAIRIGRGALVEYITALNVERAQRGMPAIPHDTDPERLYFKGVKLELVDGLNGVEIVA